MKVYIYSELQKKIAKSGVGRAIYHQRKALSDCGITLVDSVDEADVVHINTVLPNSYRLAKRLRRTGKPLVYHAHSTREDFRKKYGFSETDKIVAELPKKRKGVHDFACNRARPSPYNAIM